MKTKLEKLQNQKEKLTKKSEKLSEITDRKMVQYEVGEFEPYFLTQAFLMGAREAVENITDKAIEQPYHNKAANVVHKGLCYAFAGATAAFFFAGTLPFAALETPVAAVGCGIQGLKDLDVSIYNDRIYKAAKKRTKIGEAIKEIDSQIAELSQQRVC